MNNLPAKYPVVGVGISATDYGEVLRLCRDWIVHKHAAPDSEKPSSRSIFVCTVNAVMKGVFDPEFRALLNQGDIATTDGVPLAWVLRSMGVRRQPRVYGPNLMLALCGQAARLGHRIYLFGGREEVIPELCRVLRKKFPTLEIAGTYPHRAPPRDGDAAREAADAVRESGADIVFVGFGQPRQEQWMVRHAADLPGSVMVGVGAAFDFHTGRVRQAPAWMQDRGLEWLFSTADGTSPFVEKVRFAEPALSPPVGSSVGRPAAVPAAGCHAANLAEGESEPRAQATGQGRRAATRCGTASPRTLAHFGLVLNRLEPSCLWPVACALGSGSAW